MTTPSRWHVGARELRGAITAYAKRFDLLEVRVTAGPPPGGRGKAATAVAADHLAPALPTMRKWRKAVPPAFDFAVVAGPHLSLAKPSAAATRELEGAREAITALRARCFVLRTPPEVTPARVWRDRLAAILGSFPRDATHFVWEPSGVWEVEDAAAQAHAWGVVLAVDPARDPVPPGPVAYLRLRALGETRSFGTAALERVVHAVGPRREVFVVVETDTALAEVKRLRELSRGAAGERLGGGARLVRPRGGIVVRDDEQE